MYLDERHSSPDGTAAHRLKYAIVEDAFNEAWTEHIALGENITFDESRCVGWYNGSIQIGPEPKPI